MAEFWVRPKGSARGSADFVGWKELENAINAGTVTYGDRVEHDASQGPFGQLDRADYPCGAGATSALDYLSSGGVMFGTSQGANSKASGITFSFQNATGQAVVDMSGGSLTDPTHRTVAAFRVRGEDIKVLGLHAKASKWNYLFSGSSPAGGTRLSGSGDAETKSRENMVLVVAGNGNVIEDCDLDGSSAFSRFGLYLAPSCDAEPNASPNKTTTVRRVTMHGVCNGFLVEPRGAKQSTSTYYDMHAGNRVIIEDCFSYDACWGVAPGMSKAPYNSQAHGNGGGAYGRWYGTRELIIRRFEGTGGFQDGLATGSAAYSIIDDCYIHDLGDPSYQYWEYDGTVKQWVLKTKSNSTEGNAIKLGLGSRDGTGPLVWLGDDGIIGGDLKVDEVRNIVIRCRIRNVRGMGITGNSGRGLFIHGNEIYDTGSQGIGLFVVNTNEGWFFVSNNFVRKLTTDPSNFAFSVQSHCRVEAHNNVFWSNPDVSTQRDVSYTGSTLIKSNNLLVTGRINGSAWGAAGADLPKQTPAWIDGVGLGQGDPLRVAGNRAAILRARSYGANRNRLGEHWATGVMPVGCY